MYSNVLEWLNIRHQELAVGVTEIGPGGVYTETGCPLNGLAGFINLVDAPKPNRIE